MQTLEVKNFVTIKYAKIEIKPFVVIIGSQASGKSLLAKITYFIKEFLFSDFVSSLQKQNTWTEFEKKQEEKFFSIFPSYIWADKDFEISYEASDIILKIMNKNADGQNVFSFECSKSLKTRYSNLLKKYKEELSERQTESKSERLLPPAMNKLNIFLGVFCHSIDNQARKEFTRNIFIPAGRSFFWNIRENIFSFIIQDIEIDYFLKEFGASLERVKESYKRVKDIRFNHKDTELAIIEKLMSEIVCGKYLHKKGEDWIEGSGRRIKVVNSSSGQQEALPMLIVLMFYSNILHLVLRAQHFFIEEPEAHLFPMSQKKIIDLIGLIYNGRRDNNYFLTTHSPYILSSLNNLILAHKTAKQELKRKSISFNDISAYSLENGELKDIKDYTEEIIDARYIDDVSLCIEKEFESIMEELY